MSQNLITGLLLVLALVGANLPWLTGRFLLFIPVGKGKNEWLRLLEWLLYYFIVGLLALGFEQRWTGNIHEQKWDFYVITFSLFLVFAFPGFIYYHLLRKKTPGSS
jgi:hypothetical protein